MLLHSLESKSLISPPKWLSSNTHYLTIMGSMAYGVSSDNSDLDLFGVAIPPRHVVFPHEMGYIEGFGKRPEQFGVWQQHDIIDKSARQNYDFKIYGIVKFFQLAMDNNPDVIDSLFTRRESVIHITKTFELVREHRKQFLHKGIVSKLKGYAYKQLTKAKNCVTYLKDIREFEEKHNIPHNTTYVMTTHPEFMGRYPWSIRSKYDELWSAGLAKTKRFEAQKILGWDSKSLYHVYRLASQAEYILVHHDLDLMEDGRRAKMKAIRKGEITLEQIQSEFSEYEKRLDSLYESSTLPYGPDEPSIKNLLLTCLESHYGSIDKCFQTENRYRDAIKEISGILSKYGI